LKRKDLLAPLAAVFLLSLQGAVGGVRPWSGRAEWERVEELRTEVAALETRGELERAGRDLLEAALDTTWAVRLSGDAPPSYWRKGLESCAGGYAWGSDGAEGLYRLEVDGRFGEVLDLIGLVDAEPGPFVVRAIELSPDRGRVRLLVRLEAVRGGD
jgi:hypothetical protein